MDGVNKIKPVDRTQDIDRCDRRQDSMARLANGPNVCTAFSFFPEQNKFYASNNTNDECLIKKYMKFWKKYQVKRKYERAEVLELIKESMDGERFLATQSIGLDEKRNKLNQLETQEKYRADEIDQQLEGLEQLRQEENEAKKKIISLMSDEDFKARCDFENKIKSRRDELEALSDKKQKALKIKQIKNLQNQLQKLVENAGITEILDYIQNKRKLVEEREERIKALKTTEGIESELNKLKDEIEELEKTLEKRRGSLFEEKLKKAMSKVLSWIKSFWKPSSKRKYDKYHMIMDYEFCKPPISNTVRKGKLDSHAEMNVIQRIYEVTHGDLSRCKTIYVGISKSCCGRCINLINQIKETSARAAHCKPYPARDPPLRKELKLKTLEESLQEEGRTIYQLSEETSHNREDYISSSSLISLNSDEDSTATSNTNIDLHKESFIVSVAKK